MNSKNQTLQQQRARHALKQIRIAEETYQAEKRDGFVSCVENIPASILINGLGQAVATLRAQAKGKQEDPHLGVFNALQSWLCRNEAEAPYHAATELLVAITNGNRESYQHAQAEALAYLEWYKKFAVAFLKKLDQ